MSADTLTVESRAFFERSKSKVSVSLWYGAAAIVFLGFCAAAGGMAAAYNNVTDSSVNNSSEVEDAYTSFKGGYGFAAFCYIIAFIFALVGAFLVSPFVTGTANETKMIRSPQEVDSGYSAYSESPAK
eukprot:gene11779-8388_t